MSYISVITLTMGREHYLRQCLDSLAQTGFIVDHHVVFQGHQPSKDILDFCNLHGVNMHIYDTNIGIAAALNNVIKLCTGKLIFKMDDDCKIVSNPEEFFHHALEIHDTIPDAVFSPFPVGLINNKGGPPALRHFLTESVKYNLLYTLRQVNHVGGFARFTPKSIFDNFTFQPDLISGISGNEDGQLSNHCITNHIPMFYLENAMVVEHNESTLGQTYRYRDYFKDRRSESAMSINLIERKNNEESS